MKTKKVILLIFVLVAIDQIIKIIIYLSFLDYHFELIPSLIEFKPVFNDQHSYVNALLNKNFGFNMGLFPHLILYLFTGILILFYYAYYRNHVHNNPNLLDISFIFLYTGIICALIGNLIWKSGTLDYIYLKQLFVFDLKDTIVNFGLILFLIYMMINRRQLKPVKTMDIFVYAKNKVLINNK